MDENRVLSVLCGRCKAEIKADQNFCHNCGRKNKAAFPPVEGDISNDNTGTKARVLDIVKRSLVLAMALIMILLAFLPVVKYKMEDYIAKEDVCLKFNAIDGVKLLSNSFYSLDAKDMAEEYDDLMEDYEEYEKDWEDGDELNALARYTKKLFNLALRSEDSSLSWSIVFIAAFSIMQLIITVFLFVFAVLSFVSIFFKRRKPFKTPLALLGINAVLLFANSFAYKFLFGKTDNAYTMLSGLACTALIVAFLTFVAFAVINGIMGAYKISVGSIIKRSLSLIFAIVLIFSCYAPIAKTEIKTSFKNDDSPKKVTTNISPDIFKSFSLSESQKEYFEDATEKTVDSDIKIRYNMFSLFSKKEISSGDANSYNYDIFSTLVLGYGLHDIAPVFSFGICAIMLVMFCSLLLLFAALYGFATGHRFASGIVIPAKIISIFMAVVVLALSIVACAVAEINVDPIGITYSPAIAYGPILMLVAAVAVTAVPKTRP